MKYFWHACGVKARAWTPAEKRKKMNQKTYFLSLTLSAMLLIGASAQGQQQLTFEEGVDVVAQHRGWTPGQVMSESVGFEEAALLSVGMRVLETPAKAVPATQLLPGNPDTSLALRLIQSEFRPVSGAFTWLKTEEGLYVVLPSQERFTVLVERMKSTNQ